MDSRTCGGGGGDREIWIEEGSQTAETDLRDGMVYGVVSVRVSGGISGSL